MTKAKKYRVEWLRNADTVTMEEARRLFGESVKTKRMATLVRWRGRPRAEPMRQSELARRIGIAQKTLAHIEQGDTWPSMPLYIALCRELKLGRIPLVS